MTRRRAGPAGTKSKATGTKPRRGRPPSPDSRTIPRMIRLRPDEAAAHDAARGEQDWADWMRAAAELAIARGSTR